MKANDVVHMELRDHVAKCCDIDLVGGKNFLHDLGQPGRFLKKLPLVLFAEFKDLFDPGSAWDQDKPWIVGIVH